MLAALFMALERDQLATLRYKKLSMTRTTKKKAPAGAASARPMAGYDKKTQDRRDYIKHEAALLFGEYGYSAATMDQLSDRTGLNKGTLYYYYKSKSDILFDICVTSTSIESRKMVEPALKMEFASDGLEHFIEVIVGWVVGYRDEVRVFIQERSHFERIFEEEQYAVFLKQEQRIIYILSQLLKKGIKSGEFQSDSPDFDVQFIMGLIFWIYQWEGEDLDAQNISQSTIKFVMNGLGMKKRKRKK